MWSPACWWLCPSPSSYGASLCSPSRSCKRCSACNPSWRRTALFRACQPFRMRWLKLTGQSFRNQQVDGHVQWELTRTSEFVVSTYASRKVFLHHFRRLPVVHNVVHLISLPPFQWLLTNIQITRHAHFKLCLTHCSEHLLCLVDVEIACWMQRTGIIFGQPNVSQWNLPISHLDFKNKTNSTPSYKINEKCRTSGNTRRLNQAV